MTFDIPESAATLARKLLDYEHTTYANRWNRFSVRFYYSINSVILAKQMSYKYEIIINKQ